MEGFSETMPCPACGSTRTQTKDSRPDKLFGLTTRKRRKACACGHRFSTYEISDAVLRSMEARLDRAEATDELFAAVAGLDTETLTGLAQIIGAVRRVAAKKQTPVEPDFNDNPTSRKYSRKVGSQTPNPEGSAKK